MRWPKACATVDTAPAMPSRRIVAATSVSTTSPTRVDVQTATQGFERSNALGVASAEYRRIEAGEPNVESEIWERIRDLYRWPRK